MELPAVSTARSCKYIWYSCTEIIRRKITTRHKDKKLYLRTKINCWHKLSRFCIITLMAVLYWSSKQRALSGCWAAMTLPLPPTAAPEVPGLRAGTTTAPQEANKEIQKHMRRVQSFRGARHECRSEDSIGKVMLRWSQQQMCCSTITILTCFAVSTAVGHPPVLVSCPCHYGTRQYSFA